ncbi:MAG: antitoxin [Gemmatimonadota bacterium]
MTDFRDLEKKAESIAEEHPEQTGKGIDEAAGFAERETGHQHDEQIDRAAEAAEKRLGGQNQGQDNGQER